MAAQASSDHNSKNHLYFTLRVVLKALVLFAVINLLFAVFYPVSTLGKFSVYNTIVTGRARLPYGENPSRAYNLSLFNLDAMFASHEISESPKPEDEYRVILIGDSSTWGYLLPADKTLSAYLNQAGIVHPDGKKVRTYNLGYPVMSLAKDLLILSRAAQYQPDLIVWLVTLESFPTDKQYSAPLLQHNSSAVEELVSEYSLNLPATDIDVTQRSLWDRTIVGSRRELADWFRLQLYGFLWSATGIDQEIPDEYPARIEDFSDDDGFHDLQQPLMDESLAFDILQSGIAMADGKPVLIVNEPIFISQGVNSHIRYNFYYPRWAYDGYRQMLEARSERENWNYLDLWDSIPPTEFTNTAIHLTPHGTKMLAGWIGEAVLAAVGQEP